MPPSLRTDHEVSVHLATAGGIAFSGTARGVALRNAEGTIEITNTGESLLGLNGLTELTLRTIDGIRVFQLEAANASVRANRLSVLAQSIREIAPPAESLHPDQPNPKKPIH